MDLWQKAKRAMDVKDLAMARSLGFDYCQQCNEWFQLAAEAWRDCTSCGRHCHSCAEGVAWQWCVDCGHYVCQECAGDGPSFSCPVYQIGSAGDW